jgi:aspartate 4-decarboxylase
VHQHHRQVAAVGAEPPFGPDGGHDGGYYALIDLRHVIRSVVDLERVAAVEDQLDPVDIVRGIAADHGVVVTPGAAFDADSWDIRVSVASVTRDEAAIIGAAIVATIRAQAGAVLEP